MTPEDRARNVKRCAEIIEWLNSDQVLTEQEKAKYQHELDELRFERQRQERITFEG